VTSFDLSKTQEIRAKKGSDKLRLVDKPKE